MTEQTIPARWSILTAIIVLVAISRLIPYALHIEDTFNFSPLAALALFGGAYFLNRGYAMLFPLLALWFSNLLLDNLFLSNYYTGFALFENWEVYVAIIAIVMLAFFVLRKVTVTRVIGASIGASILFFLITNFVVWMKGIHYPMTWAGFMTCYEMAIPFFRNTLLGDLVFSMMLFGTFEWVKSRYPNVVLEKG